MEWQTNHISQAGFPEGYIIFAQLKLEIKLEESRKQPEKDKGSKEQRKKENLFHNQQKQNGLPAAPKPRGDAAKYSTVTDTVRKSCLIYFIHRQPRALWSVNITACHLWLKKIPESKIKHKAYP